MPTYEYRCRECGHDLEALQRMSDDPLRDCPECGEPALERLVSQSSFTLKGGGWYADGYGAGKSPGTPPAAASAESDKEPAKKDDAKKDDAKKADAKPEPKAATKPDKPASKKPSGDAS